ncbi:MAG: hypothetical protein ACK45F_06250 [bacterium]
MRRVFAGLLVFMWMTAVGWAAPTGFRVEGDARAWEEVGQALARLASLRSYRARVDLGQGQTMAVEFVNPDRVRMVVAGGEMEIVRVGQQQRFRMAGGPWQCVATVPMPEVPTGRPAEGETAVTIHRGPEAQVGGERTRTYRYWFGTRLESVMRLYVSVRTGLPRRLEMLDARGRTEVTVDYGDFNAPIQIELPPC